MRTELDRGICSWTHSRNARVFDVVGICVILQSTMTVLVLLMVLNDIADGTETLIVAVISSRTLSNPTLDNLFQRGALICPSPGV